MSNGAIIICFVDSSGDVQYLEYLSEILNSLLHKAVGTSYNMWPVNSLLLHEAQIVLKGSSILFSCC
jgi:hypothetical protein